MDDSTVQLSLQQLPETRNKQQHRAEMPVRKSKLEPVSHLGHLGNCVVNGQELGEGIGSGSEVGGMDWVAGQEIAE